MPAVSMEEQSPSGAKASSLRGPINVRAEARTLKDGALLLLELWSTGFAVISVHQRGMEITVNGNKYGWSEPGGTKLGFRPVTGFVALSLLDKLSTPTVTAK